jgi:hypothetical protein
VNALLTLLSDPQVVAALITVALTVIAGSVGYFLREWLSRSKPFIAITGIEGDAKRGGARIEVPEKIVKALEQSQIQPRLSQRSRLPDIDDTLAAANDVRNQAQDLIDTARKFKLAAAANDQSAAQSALAELMLDEEFDLWACILIGERAVSVPPYDPMVPVVIDCSEEPNARGGAFAIGFPGRSFRFGSSLNDYALYKSGVAALVELVKRMELSKLSAVLDGIAQQLSQEISIARDIAPGLQEIIDKNSQWSIQIYVANLGKSPFLVQTSATMEIIDRSGAKYSEHCSLLIFEDGPNVERSRIKATSPLVVKAESDVTFEFVTNSTQSEMVAGDAVRALYKAKSASVHMSFSIDRPGLIRTKVLRSERVNFSDAQASAA